MSFNARMSRAKIAEDAVKKFLTECGWQVSANQFRSSLDELHNNTLSLEGKTDIVSKFIRHFPDHIATKERSILIQTKYAQAGYDFFTLEKDSFEALLLMTFPEQIWLIFYVAEENKFYAITANVVSHEIKEKNLQAFSDHHGDGSGTPYYLIPRNIFLDTEAFKNVLSRSPT